MLQRARRRSSPVWIPLVSVKEICSTPQLTGCVFWLILLSAAQLYSLMKLQPQCNPFPIIPISIFLNQLVSSVSPRLLPR